MSALFSLIAGVQNSVHERKPSQIDLFFYIRVQPVLSIPTGFNVDPNPSFYLIADPDSGSQTNAYGGRGA